MLILGIQCDPPFLREVLIQKGRKGIEIRSMRESLLSDVSQGMGTPKNEAFFGGPGSNVKPLYIGFKGRIATGISAKDFLLRSLELKIANPRHAEEAVAFQSEAISHFNPAEMISVPLLQKRDKKSTEALVFTVPRSALQQHLFEFERLRVDPDAVGAIPLALCHFIRWKFPNLFDAFIIDLGSTEWTCAWMEQGTLKKAHGISGGIEVLLASLLEDRKKILLKKEIEGAAKQIDLLLLKPGLNPHLTGKLQELRQELSKVHHFFQRGAEKKPVIFTGRTDAFIHLCEFLIDGLELQWPLTLEEQKFASTTGLALSQTTAPSLQLRREEFFPRKNWSRLGLYALSLMAFSVILSGILFGFGLWSLHSRKADMLFSLQSSFQNQNLLSEEGTMEEKIDRWISAVETHTKEYPYILQAPKAAEVLAWVASHPLLEELKREGDPIELREIRYQLVKFPKITAPKEAYLAKVELEFQFKSSTNARKFHEALRKGDERVDPHLEMTWDALSDGYRCSFFLKNRSPYVPFS